MAATLSDAYVEPVPIVRSSDIPQFEVDGVRAWGLATKARGASEVMLWRHHIAPGQLLPSTRHDHEEVIAILSGAGNLYEPENTTSFQAGDVLIVPAGTITQIEAAPRTVPLECLRAMPLATRHYTTAGEEMYLPWTR
jgi:quercetin dioxygenase-like cupin family protein